MEFANDGHRESHDDCIITSSGDSSQTNSHSGFATESVNDGHFRIKMKPMKDGILDHYNDCDIHGHW